MATIDIYTTPSCGFCHAAKELLARKGVKYNEINVMGDPAKRQEMVARSNGGMTVPQIFIDGAHVGGCDDLYDLDHEGKLDPLLSASA